jgi:hypothetical protein
MTIEEKIINNIEADVKKGIVNMDLKKYIRKTESGYIFELTFSQEYCGTHCEDCVEEKNNAE